VYDDDGELRIADRRPKVIDWPMRDESRVVDEGEVWFPKMTEHLGDQEIAKYLTDDKTYVVAAFDGFDRTADRYRDDYLSELLRSKDPSRKIVIDMFSPQISIDLAEAALKLDGHPFVVVGVTKHDFMYSGMDFSYQMWRRLGEDTNRFRLLGLSARLPEAAARVWVSGAEHSMLTVAGTLFWKSAKQVTESTSLSIGLFVLLTAIVLRVLLAPFGILEARSRFLRRGIERLSKREPRPVWSGSAVVLGRRLGARRLWEIIGGLLTVALILPAYRILTSPPNLLGEQSFLWIADLGKPDLILNVLVGALVLVKLRVGNGSLRNLMVSVGVAVGFAALLLLIPSGVTIYLFGVLLVTVTQDIVAHASSRAVLNRALSHKSRRAGVPISIIVVLCAGAVLLTASPALALPTPDVLVGVVNLVPVLIGAAVSAFGGAWLLFRRSGRFRAMVVLSAVVLIGASFGAYTWHKARTDERIRNTALYLRCDVGHHNNRALRRLAGHEDNWRKYGNFREFKWTALPEMLERQPSAALIATYHRSVDYYSGIPAVHVDGVLRPFEFVFRNEVHTVLRGLDVEDLYLLDFSPLIFQPGRFSLEMRKSFKKFRNVYTIRRAPRSGRYVYDDEGNLQQPDRLARVIDWPVFDERRIIDERAVWFPKMTKQLGDRKVEKYLTDDKTYVVAVFDSYDRSAEHYEKDYLEPLLQGKDRSLIIVIDMFSPRISEDLAEAALRVDGRPFVVVGLTKHDFLYSGMDFAFQMWRRLDKDTDRFKLLGFSARLPEAAARVWVKRAEDSPIKVAGHFFWRAADSVTGSTVLSIGAFVLLTAIVLRLLLSPFGVLEARSRFLRRGLERLSRKEPRPAWSGSAVVLAERLGVRRVWEIIGG